MGFGCLLHLWNMSVYSCLTTDTPTTVQDAEPEELHCLLRCEVVVTQNHRHLSLHHSRDFHGVCVIELHLRNLDSVLNLVALGVAGPAMDHLSYDMLLLVSPLGGHNGNVSCELLRTHPVAATTFWKPIVSRRLWVLWALPF